MNKYFSLKNALAATMLFALAIPSYKVSAQSKDGMGSSVTLGMEPFVTKLMSKMTVDEKIGQLNLVVTGNVATGTTMSKGIEEKLKRGEIGGLFGTWGTESIKRFQDVAVKNSRLHIPLIFGLDVIHGHRTIFPIPLGVSATWDMGLIEQSARTAAKEATAEGLNWVFSPMVDIARDPRWGRISEGSGEDAWYGSQVAKAMVKGYQGKNMTDADGVMACVKHFALYGGAEAGREYNTVDMSLIKMYQDYLPPYKAAVDAGAGSFMSSFNEINGVPAAANQWLLTDLLRKQWGFNGMVATDYTTIMELTNHGVGNAANTTQKAKKTKNNKDMVSEFYLNELPKSLKEGKITQQEIDMACRRVLEAKYKLGLFNNAYKSINPDREKQD